MNKIMKPYYIFSPPYNHNSGGVKVLYKLCEKLKEAGQTAFIINYTSDEVALQIQQEDAIMVYPEIITGNPYNAKTVARYVLYYAGILGGEKIYDSKELVFSYSKLYDSSIQNTIQGHLFLPVLDFNIFKNYNFKRSGSAFYVGKGVLDVTKLPVDCLEITRDFPATAEALAIIFNLKETIYCFDHATSIINEAIICGCKIVLLDDRYKDKFNPELDIKDSETTRQNYLQAEKEFTKQLQHFIEVTQNSLTKV
jgi:O-antigen biosynthesis protein